jgi:hypothetical protein
LFLFLSPWYRSVSILKDGFPNLKKYRNTAWCKKKKKKKGNYAFFFIFSVLEKTSNQAEAMISSISLNLGRKQAITLLRCNLCCYKNKLMLCPVKGINIPTHHFELLSEQAEPPGLSPELPGGPQHACPMG